MIDTAAQIAMFRELLDSIEHHMDEANYLEQQLQKCIETLAYYRPTDDDDLPF
jgi:prefoldin subunit 5